MMRFTKMKLAEGPDHDPNTGHSQYIYREGDSAYIRPEDVVRVWSSSEGTAVIKFADGSQMTVSGTPDEVAAQLGLTPPDES